MTDRERLIGLIKKQKNKNCLTFLPLTLMKQ